MMFACMVAQRGQTKKEILKMAAQVGTMFLGDFFSTHFNT